MTPLQFTLPVLRWPARAAGAGLVIAAIAASLAGEPPAPEAQASTESLRAPVSAPAAPTPAENGGAVEITAAPTPATSAPAAAGAAAAPGPAVSTAADAGEAAAAASTAPATKESGGATTPVPATKPPAASEPVRVIQSLFNLGATFRDRKDYSGAEIAFQQILNHEAARPTDRSRALLELARVYRLQGTATRAAACYEKYLTQYPDDEGVPMAHLELGRVLRSLGAYRLALNSFYSVINTTLRLSQDGFDQYRVISKTAQFEIAETHFQKGEFAEASKYFSRLQLLDLAAADRARAQFKSASALVLAKDHEAAVTALRVFLEQHPDDENVPEARYLLSISLRRLGRNQEAFDMVLALLRAEKAREYTDPRRWAYWQRRTGNQVANEFYEQGSVWGALLIYEALTTLSEQEPVWRLPALYQSGLCHERLRQYDRARENYEAVVKGCAAVAAREAAASGLDDLGRMASWRLEHLSWSEKIDAQIARLFNSVSLTSNEQPGPDAKLSRALR